MRALELESKLLLRGFRTIVETRTIHADDLERLVAQVVRLLGVERENLKRDLGIGYHDGGNHFGAGLYCSGAAMVAVGSPVSAGGVNGDDRLGETIELF